MPTWVSVMMHDAYGNDFNVWVTETAQLLRQGRWQEIDLPHLIEEVEDLGKRERRAIASQLSRLLLHLLKWQYQPQRRSDSWLDSITDARTQLELAIAESPSLKSYPDEVWSESYQRARRQAARQTGLDLTVFPDSCPYDLQQVLSEEWLPNGDLS